jgi:glycosyltransferase involved in cell wall biosynthesis
MRVLLSNASFKWGGVHQITDQLATGLRQRGHDVSLICRPGSLLEQRLRDRFPCEPLARGMDFSPHAIFRIGRALRRIRPDVVLTMMDKDLRLTGAAARLHGIPVIARRANDRPIGSGLYARLVYDYIVSHHVANSEATRRTLLESAPWLKPASITVIHNGIDVQAIDAAVPAALPIDQTGVVFGFIGRLDQRKGTRDLLDAWPGVSAALEDASLVIVGKGFLEQEVADRARTLERVTYLGYRADVASVLKAVDVVVVPSLWEGFGLIAAEALAAQRPVIASDASSLPEIVRHEREGWLVPPAQPTALAAAMIAAARAPEARARMGKAGRERVEQHFSLDRMVGDYERLLQNIVHQNATERA